MVDEERRNAWTERAVEYVQKTFKTGPGCPICQGTTWTVSSPMEGRTYAGGSLVIGGGELYVFIPVTCKECAYTFLFNAVAAGIITDEEAEEAQEGAPQ